MCFVGGHEEEATNMKEAKNMRSLLIMALADAHLKKDAHLVKGAIHKKTAADPWGTTRQNSEDSSAPIAGVENLLITAEHGALWGDL